MNVDFITISENNNNRNERFVKAGKYLNNENMKENLLCEFVINISKINNKKYNTFIKKVENYKNCKLMINDDEYIQYVYSESSVVFKTNKIYIKLIQELSPESIYETLIGFF